MNYATPGTMGIPSEVATAPMPKVREDSITGMAMEQEKTIFECNLVLSQIVGNLTGDHNEPKHSEPQCLMQQMQSNCENLRRLMDSIFQVRDLVNGGEYR